MKMDDLKNLDAQALIEQIQGLDPQNVGSWPMPIKLACAVIVFVAVVVGTYFLSITAKHFEKEQLTQTEQTLLQQYEEKAHRAQNLDQYRRQLVSMEESFGALLQQLPRDTEVPGLLEDITHTGLGSGLELTKIELGAETEKEFYAELPIKIEVKGDYHGFGSFVSGVSSLPRIVTLHDFTIAPAKGSGGRSTGSSDVVEDGVLQLNVTARTYRYASRQTASNPQQRTNQR